jgi:metal-responsive CopG/Arc/MetJ family transcriptional regulator
MRCVVSLSLPEDLCKEVQNQMKKHKFTSKSEFIRHILRYWLQHNK